MSEIQTMWSWLPAIYLFLGGLAGGTFLISSVVRLRNNDKYSTLKWVAPWVSMITLVIGLLCLIAEVDNPLKAIMMWKSFVNTSSWMMIGAWLVFIAVVVFFINALASTPVIRQWVGERSEALENAAPTIVKWTMILGSVLGLCVAIYTGILLRAAGNIPFWHTWIIPALFTVSALDAGASVVILIMLFEKRDTDSSVHNLQISLLVLIAAEAAVIAFLLYTMSGRGISEALSVAIIMSGQNKFAFWGLIVGVGLLVPFVLGIMELAGVIKDPELAHKLHLVAIACALIGGFTLRYVMLSSGIHGAMMSPDASQAVNEIYYVIK